MTIPDRTIHHHTKPLLEVLNPEEGVGNTSDLLNESMSYHYLKSSVYEARGNLGEAKYIANMIKTLLLQGTRETIGIVAFSQEQQEIIENAIDTLTLTDKAFEEALEKAYNRKDEGQFTGLFVKNLENVQGDERDIIIMSVCYGFDSNKKMLMNFGPINRKGGEKRLNVIFSRAKKHMAVVSSIRHYHITNDHNEGANYFRHFLQYAEMISTGNFTMARTILDGLITNKHQKKEFFNELTVTTKAIRQALEARGYLVDERIGQSNFKCSLGVKKASSDNQYSLGILVDDSFHYSNDDLIEQYYQRPSILETFGWKIISVYAKDWLANSNHVLSGIIKQIEGLETNDKFVPDEQELSHIQTKSGGIHNVFTELHSSDGTMFWKVHQADDKLEIHQGRIGHKGQVQIKTFPSESEAADVKERLLLEQISMGFNMINPTKDAYNKQKKY